MRKDMESNDLENIASQYKEIKLPGMAQVISDVACLPIQEWPSTPAMLKRMVETEKGNRDSKRTERLLKESKVRYRVNIESVICSPERNFTKDQLEVLASCNFIRRGENVIITGQTGCGKSHLACAFLTNGCYKGYSGVYISMNRFVDELKQANLSGTLREFLDRLKKFALIVWDDFGLQPLDTQTRLAILTILEERYDTKSMIIVSQIPFEKWYDYIGDPTFADAILDRLKNTSHHIRLQGESLRKRKF